MSGGDARDLAMGESGGEVTNLGFVREPVTGYVLRVPTDEEMRRLRGAEGLMRLIFTDWERRFPTSGRARR